MTTLRIHVQCPKCPNVLLSSSYELKDGDRHTCPFCSTPVKIKIISDVIVGEPFAEGEEIPAE